MKTGSRMNCGNSNDKASRLRDTVFSIVLVVCMAAAMCLAFRFAFSRFKAENARTVRAGRPMMIVQGTGTK